MMKIPQPTWSGGRVIPLVALVGLSAAAAVGSLTPASPHSFMAATAFRRAVNNMLHVPAYAVLTLAWAWSLHAVARMRTSRAALAGAGAALLYGIAMEFGQMAVPGRTASVGDALRDAAGAALALGVIFVFARIRAAGAARPRGAVPR